MTTRGPQMTTRGLQLTSRVPQVTSRGLQLTSRGPQVTSRGLQLTSRVPQVTSRGLQRTSRGPQLTSRGPQLTTGGPTSLTMRMTTGIQRDGVCNPNPCRNHGICAARSTSSTGFVCTCPRGLWGQLCQQGMYVQRMHYPAFRIVHDFFQTDLTVTVYSASYPQRDEK